jgi:hypothetical protein
MADKQETIVKEYTSYNTNLTPQDVVLTLPGSAISYLSQSHFYLCDYTVYQGESEQNYTWSFRIIKNSHKWGTVYTLMLYISNGFFCIKISTVDFTVGDKSAKCLDIWSFRASDICEDIASEFKLFVQESLLTMKQHNRNYDAAKQEALAYIYSEFSLLAKEKKVQEAEHEMENEMAEQEAYLAAMRDLENEMAEQEAYLAAMRRSMRRGYYDW